MNELQRIADQYRRHATRIRERMPYPEDRIEGVLSAHTYYLEAAVAIYRLMGMEV